VVRGIKKLKKKNHDLDNRPNDWKFAFIFNSLTSDCRQVSWLSKEKQRLQLQFF